MVYVNHSSFDQEEGESVLAEQGIRLAYVRGDVTTNAIVMVVDSEVLVRWAVIGQLRHNTHL